MVADSGEVDALLVIFVLSSPTCEGDVSRAGGRGRPGVVAVDARIRIAPVPVRSQART